MLCNFCLRKTRDQETIFFSDVLQGCVKYFKIFPRPERQLSHECDWTDAGQTRDNLNNRRLYVLRRLRQSIAQLQRQMQQLVAIP